MASEWKESEPLEVLFADRQVVVISKPAGLLSQGDRTGDADAAAAVREWLTAQLPPEERGRSLFVAPVHRLDRPVSGALALARTSKAASRLSAQFRTSSVEKRYLALCPAGIPDAAEVRLWLQKDRQANRVRWSTAAKAGWQEAVTEVAVRARHGDLALVELRPATGRPHQLRATLASRGTPIIGDLRYGDPRELGRAIALHAHLLAFDHPISGERVEVNAPLPALWLREWPWLADLSP